MALGAATLWEMNSGATASNANGGGFNPGNAGMLTNLAGVSGCNTSTPVVSSASYNFVAADVGNWLYIKSGTNWTPGFYKIASVASNQATLTAGVGTADQPSLGFYYANTVAGCATTATPSSGTFSIDYSRSTAAISSTAVSDYTAVGASLTLTSATAAFTPVMAGNIFFQSTTGTGAFGVIGRYEVATYVNATTVTLDRTPNTGTASVATTGKIGGALSLGSSDDAIFETIIAGNIAYVKGNTTFTLGGAVSIASAGTAIAPINIVGYASQRGDNPTGSTRPIFALGSSAFAMGTYWNMNYMQGTGTGTSIFGVGNGIVTRYVWVKAINSSTTINRVGFLGGNNGMNCIACEAISYRGVAIQSAFGILFGCYVHDSNEGFAEATTNGSYALVNCIISACVTIGAQINTTTSSSKSFINNTFMGSTTPRGTAITIPANGAPVIVNNNIITGFTTGISTTTATTDCFGDYNDFFNNTTDVSNWNKGLHDISVDPQFADVVERTGSTATTTAGSHLVQPGATFITWGITPGVDYIYVSFGTGITSGVYGIASVDSETQITTDVNLSANATADKLWFILQGGNFYPGANVKAAGYPGVFPGGLTTGYIDIGGVQRQEGAGSAGNPSFAS